MRRHRRAQCARRARAQGLKAGEDDRARGALKAGAQRPQRRIVRADICNMPLLGCGRHAPLRTGHRRHRRRNIKMHRPARRCQRKADGARHHPARAVRLDLKTRLHQRAQQRRVVNNLVRVAGPHRALHHAGHDDQRRALLHRVGNAVHRVGEARSQCCHQQARRAADGARPRRHHGSRCLVARQHKRDARRPQRVNQRDNLAARHAKGKADAGTVQGLRDSVGDAGRRTCGISHASGLRHGVAQAAPPLTSGRR